MLARFFSGGLIYRYTFVLELLVLETLLCSHFQRRERFAGRAWITLPLLLAFGLFMPFHFDNAVIISTIVFVLSIPLWQFLFQITAYTSVFLCVTAYLLQNITMNIGKLIAVLLQLSVSWIFLYDGAALILVYCVFYLLLIRRGETFRILEDCTAGNHLPVLTSVTSICILVTMNTLFGTTGLDYNPICRIALILTGCFALSLQHSELRWGSLAAENHIIQQLMEAERQQYHISKENIDIINMKCHDLKHQLAAIRSASGGEQQAALQRVEEAVLIYNSVAKTGNGTLDAVLTEKMFFCEKHHILLTYMVDAEELGIIQDADLYVLFGNALDNAIENVLKEDENSRTITLQICRKLDSLSIHLENYCTCPLRFQDGLPQTTKRDKRSHGFGVKSIRHLAQHYGGHATFRQEHNLFLLDIMIPLPQTA